MNECKINPNRNKKPTPGVEEKQAKKCFIKHSTGGISARNLILIEADRSAKRPEGVQTITKPNSARQQIKKNSNQQC